MQINFISATNIISELYDEFNIKSDDWIGRVPNWIYKALNYYKNNKCYITEILEGNIIDNMIVLPDYPGEIKLLLIDNEILINSDISKLYYTNLDNIRISTLKYSIENNILYLEKNIGNYKLYYHTIPIEFNEKFQIFVPKIPNRPYVIDNIKWFVLKNILSRGYIHPVYSLGNRNQEYDPNIKWQQSIIKARVDLSTISKEDRNDLVNINTTFLNAPNYITNKVKESYHLNK
jgi:hypothetical protein